MNEVPLCILRCDDLENLVHVVDHTIPSLSLGPEVIILMASQEVLDFRERLLDWVEIG